MTDNEIIKALECCISEDFTCNGCPYIAVDMSGAEYDCSYYARKDALELIKRQQEEIDLLKFDNERMTTKVFDMAMREVLTKKVRAEAIKEFADKLLEKGAQKHWVDNLVKEMVGDSNA